MVYFWDKINICIFHEKVHIPLYRNVAYISVISGTFMVHHSMWGGKVSNYMHFSRYPNKMPEVTSFEIFASQNIPQYVWFPSIFNIYKRYTKSIWRDIYLIRYQIYVDSKFAVHIFFRYLEISHIYLLHIPRDTFPHWVISQYIMKGKNTWQNYIISSRQHAGDCYNFKNQNQGNQAVLE